MTRQRDLSREMFFLEPAYLHHKKDHQSEMQGWQISDL